MFDNDSDVTENKHASNYARNLLEQFSLMRDHADQCDFRINVNGKDYRCHKVLLIAASDYFKAMFNSKSCSTIDMHYD
jgi:hypothetical protein